MHVHVYDSDIAVRGVAWVVGVERWMRIRIQLWLRMQMLKRALDSKIADRHDEGQF